ncbi:glycosyl transferase family protein [Enterobacter asburiae]|uniref:Glycosyl transferase family protein n=1 Tax=Enterobacter asburiae TaxID=61645 RepID=A0A376FMS3_ENTAS|nr:glycosyl transferase family protein [Enterobacter asburiae]
MMTGSSSYEQLQKFVTDLNDPRVVYTHNAINSGACAVRNQAIMQAKGQYLTGIDDDDEWTPNRLSIFLSHKEQLVTHAFLYANDYVCQGEVYSQPRACRCIRNHRTLAACSTSATLLVTRSSLGRGVSKSACSIPNSRPARITISSCAWWWNTASRGKWKRHADPAYQPRGDANHLLAEKSSPATSIFTASTRTSLTVQP